MLIVCPSCASEYQIPTDRVGADGRSVRCAACRETWFIGPDEVSAALEAEMTEMMMAAAGPGAAEGRAAAQTALDAWESALTDGAEPAESPVADDPSAAARAKTAKRAASKTAKPFLRRIPPAAILGIAVTGALAVALIGRTPLVRLVPQSAGLYARIGLPVNLRGIELRDVVAFQTPGEGGQLVVEGDLVGTASGGATVPPIEVEVRDANDQSLYRWSIAPPRPAMKNRETARFRASLSAPPIQGRAVQVRFAADAKVPETTASTAMDAPEVKTGVRTGHP
ncbi:hypothetical protein G3T14_01380 [Methylobacterium sp. BTF04]|uniref:zinc-ribbon domain-containing protein n=1 Tax=Methylobacterium sp. BTF04 TaxID=2708300 RepID=UPI0013CFCFD9|nr:zinc-ribbon domain-containing protein [Methylobacterium sp. BTF04]NEU10783.1 hypothetical protein [Methylobacterium sp. BTF04]